MEAMGLEPTNLLTASEIGFSALLDADSLLDHSGGQQYVVGLRVGLSVTAVLLTPSWKSG